MAKYLRAPDVEELQMVAYEEEPEPKPIATTAGAQMVPVGQLYPNPNNPRKKFDQEELDKLTASVRQLGILSPILVVQDGDRYRIVAGERRYQAAQAAGLGEVPVLVRELSEAEEFEVMLTENLQREDLDPIEEALAFAGAIARGWKQTELAERLGISQAQVANRLRLLKLPESIQESISHGIISPSAGRELLSCKQAANPEIIEKIANEIAQNRLPVKDIAPRMKSEIFYASRPLSNVYAHQQNHEVLFDIQLCEDCEKKTMLKRPWVKAEEEEPQPYCLDVGCWNKKQEEAKQRRDEDKEKKLLKRYPDVVVLDDDGDMERYAYILLSTSLREHCKSIECENFKVTRYRGCNWTRDICLDSKKYESCREKIEQQSRQDKEIAKNAFDQEKKNLVENFNSLNIWDPNSANSAVFMVLRVFELTAGSPSLYAGDTGNALFNYLGIDMPDGLSWVEEAAVLEGHLREIKSIPDMIDIVLFLLLDSVQDYNKSWQLTFGADEP